MHGEVCLEENIGERVGLQRDYAHTPSRDPHFHDHARLNSEHTSVYFAAAIYSAATRELFALYRLAVFIHIRTPKTIQASVVIFCISIHTMPATSTANLPVTLLTYGDAQCLVATSETFEVSAFSLCCVYGAYQSCVM